MSKAVGFNQTRGWRLSINLRPGLPRVDRMAVEHSSRGADKTKNLKLFKSKTTRFTSPQDELLEK
jgi:hypothetical protein